MKMIKSKYLIVPVLFLALAACSPAGKQSVNTSQGSNTIEAVGNTVAPLMQTEIASATTPSVVQGSTTDNSLWIKILQPLDGDVVNQSKIELKGQAPIGTTISINNAIVYTETSQDFSVTLDLTSGANLFEIIASDIQDNQVTLYLTVYYEP